MVTRFLYGLHVTSTPSVKAFNKFDNIGYKLRGKTLDLL